MSEDLKPIICPDVVRANRTVNDVTFLGGVGKRDARIMFVSPAALEEELSAVQRESYGRETKVKPSHLKGPAGAIFKDLTLSCGIDLADNFYTSICRWLLPKAQRMKPSKASLDEGMKALRTDIREIKPEIIVCLGKPAFDQFVDIKVKLQDVAGGWFRSEEFNCLIYPMEAMVKLVSKPEYVERFRMDIREIRRMRDKLDGIKPDNEPEEDYRVIRTSCELRDLIDELSGVRLLSVDCEWHGLHHVDGSLRSIQLCWAPGKAAYIMFMNERMEYVFDVTYSEAGAIMSPLMDHPDLKYVGHHIAADLPWMHTVLDLEWYQKVFMDTEFAQQTEDEHVELGLERLGMMYTTMGRYDLDLTLWCKKNSKLVQDGYGLVPDEILIPYALKDVDVVMRSWPRILQRLVAQGLDEYYFSVFNPFVTDVFTNFVIQGLPVNEEQLTRLRHLYHYVRDELDKEFRSDIELEAGNMMLRKCLEYNRTIDDFMEILVHRQHGRHDESFDHFKKMVGVTNLLNEKPLFDHFLLGDKFNIRSPEQMRRWLFEVKKYEPVKSTNNRDKGMPSMDWSKVMDLEASRRTEFTPSTDKQTLDILAATHSDEMLRKLLRLNAVGNICKAFLKKGHVDSDGEVDREAGLHFFLASDDRLHGQNSCTETGRPRSWKPNSLNLPSWVNSMIADGMADVLISRKLNGSLPHEFEQYLRRAPNKKTGIEEWQAKVPSIRSCIQAPADWCMVESDYQTAEIRGLAFISGDENLINIITKPDVNFAKVKAEFMTDDDCVCRLGFPEYLSLVDEDAKSKVRMTYTVDGKETARFTDDQLLRDEHGNIVCARSDLHWSLAEMVHKKPREILNKKRDRGAAKVGNFSSAYGASPDTIERKIESDTGLKPEEGTGQGILDALAERQPVATGFLEDIAEVPASPGFIRAASGRIRHFYTHGENIPGLGGRQHKGVLAAMGREARNFPMQESVAATAAIAGVGLLDFGRRHGLRGSPMTILYDSVVTLCPVEEREIWAKAHELFMFRAVGWAYGSNILNYPIDTEINTGWSARPDKSTQALLDDMSWRPVPDALKYLLAELDLALDRHKSDVRLGVRNKRDLP